MTKTSKRKSLWLLTLGCIEYLLICSVALWFGCASQPSANKRIVTPARIVECPVCGAYARLVKFNDHKVDYECGEHDLVWDRYNGSFESAHPKLKKAEVTTRNE